MNFENNIPLMPLCWVKELSRFFSLQKWENTETECSKQILKRLMVKKYIKTCMYERKERAKKTHHTTGGVQLSVRNASEVATAAAIVLWAVSHWTKGVQKNFQTIKGWGYHQLLPEKHQKHRVHTVSLNYLNHLFKPDVTDRKTDTDFLLRRFNFGKFIIT